MPSIQTNEGSEIERYSSPRRDLWEVISSSGELAVARPTGKMTDEEANARIEIWQDGRTFGRREQQEEVDKVLNKIFVENMENAALLAYKILDDLVEMSYKAHDVFVRIDAGLFNYEMLVVVDEDAFVADEFDSLYDTIYRVNQEAKTDTFIPSVRFLPVEAADTHVEPYNIRALYGDGYVYRLRERSQA